MIGLKVLFILSVMIALGNAAPSEGSLDAYTYVPNVGAAKGSAIGSYRTLSEAKASCSANEECKQIVDITCKGKGFVIGSCDSSPCERTSSPGSCSWFKVSGESSAFADQGRTLNTGNALSRSKGCRRSEDPLNCLFPLFSGRASRSVTNGADQCPCDETQDSCVQCLKSRGCTSTSWSFTRNSSGSTTCTCGCAN